MNQALTGNGILVTRPCAQSGELTKALTAAGGNVFLLPVIEIVPRDPATIAADAATLPEPNIIIFVSQNAVLYGGAAIRQVTSDAALIAAIGSATRSALSDGGFEIHICPTDKFDSEHLLAHAALQDVVGKNILIVRGNSGRELMADTLAQRGATVSYLVTYQRKTATVDPQLLGELTAEWRNGAINTVIVMSIDSLTSLLEILPSNCHNLLRKTRLVTPSERVIQTAAESLPGVTTVLADSPLVNSLVDAIIE